MGELLTNHHGIKVEVVESMEMASRVNPRPGRVPEQDLLTPKTRFRWWRRDETFRGRWPKYDGLRRPWAPHHVPAWLEVGPRHQMVWRPRGSPPSPLWTPCTCRENRNLAFRFVQFRECSPTNLSEREIQKKTGIGTVASC